MAFLFPFRHPLYFFKVFIVSHKVLNFVNPNKFKDSEMAKSRLVADVNRQIEKRQKFHRRRLHDDDKDITYINERNRKFNEKIDRSYSKYTQEIKTNLERGTAI